MVTHSSEAGAYPLNPFPRSQGHCFLHRNYLSALNFNAENAPPYLPELPRKIRTRASSGQVSHSSSVRVSSTNGASVPSRCYGYFLFVLASVFLASSSADLKTPHSPLPATWLHFAFFSLQRKQLGLPLQSADL